MVRVNPATALATSAVGVPKHALRVIADSYRMHHLGRSSRPAGLSGFVPQGVLGLGLTEIALCLLQGVLALERFIERIVEGFEQRAPPNLLKPFQLPAHGFRDN